MRNASAILYKYKNLRILLDCGQNVTRTILKYGESFDLNMILITHLHGDHFYGILGLLDTMNKNNRVKPLYVYGPKNIYYLTQIHRILNKKFSFEIFVEIMPVNYCICFEGIEITAYEMNHTIPTLGYVLKYNIPYKLDLNKIEAKGLKPGPWCKKLLENGQVSVNNVQYKIEDFTRSKARDISTFYTGDTRPLNLNLKITNLIHECTYYNEIDLAIKNKHTAYTQLNKIRKMYDVSNIFLTHISEKFHAKIKELVLDTDVKIVHDGYTINLDE